MNNGPPLSVVRDIDIGQHRPRSRWNLPPDPTPLDVMRAAMMDAVASGNIELAADFAKDLAPYLHPRLAAMAVQTRDVSREAAAVTVDRPPPLSREEWIAERQRALAAPVVEGKLKRQTG